MTEDAAGGEDDEPAPDDERGGQRRRRRDNPDRRLKREGEDIKALVRSLKAADIDDAEEALRDLRHEARAELLNSDSYTLVFLLALLIVILIPATEDNLPWQLIVSVLSVGTLLLALRRSHLSSTALRRLSFLGAAAGGLTLVTQILHSGFGINPRGLLAATSLLFTFLMGLSIPAMLRRVLQSRKVTLNTLSGALAAYLMLGLLFASLFRFMSLADTTQESPFFAQNPTPTTADFEYFSFITITTVGYGDLTPGNDAARAGSVAEAIIGQVFLVTIVARVVSQLGTERRPIQRRTGEREGDGERDGDTPD